MKKSGKNDNETRGQKLTAKEEEFLRFHKTLRGELDNASWHFTAWKSLWKLVEGYVDEFNVAHTFFRLTMRAHLLEALLRLNKICDKGGDGLNMPEFLDFIRKDLDIFALMRAETGKHTEKEYDVETEIIAEEALLITPELVEQHINQIESLPVDKLKGWTQDALAHVDRHVAKSHIRLLEESPVDIEEVDRIIETVHTILNVYSKAYDGQTWDKHLVFEHGLHNMMEAVKSGRKQKAEQP